jgi:xanthine/uracil permease
MLQNILWGFITIIIGVNLAPTVANQVASAKANTNFSSTDTTLLGLVTTFFVIAILSVGITLVSVSFRNAGLA